MSRGFVKEDDLELAGTDLPERPVSNSPNYVTSLGMDQLKHEVNRLTQQRQDLIQNKEDTSIQQRLAETERDLRYYTTRLEQAILVPPLEQPIESVRFGAQVTVEDEHGQQHHFKIVGEDEANIALNKVSYVSPIAQALIGKKVGDSVIWQRPVGHLLLEIIEINA